MQNNYNDRPDQLIPLPKHYYVNHLNKLLRQLWSDAQLSAPDNAKGAQAKMIASWKRILMIWMAEKQGIYINI